MKVAQINSVCGKGSTGRIVVEISDFLTHNKIDNQVYFGVGVTKQTNATKITNGLYLKYNILNTRLLGKHGFYSRLGTYRLLKMLDNYSPDVIHLHQPHGHYLNIELFIKYINKKKIPLIWTLHDCWVFTGHCVHFTNAKCTKWRTGCGYCPQLNKYPCSLIFDRSAESYKAKKLLLNSMENVAFVAVSDWIYNISRDSLIKTQSVVTIYNGVDTNIFSPKNSEYLKESLGFKNKFVVLGMANKWIVGKDLSKVNKIIENVSDDVILLLIGVPINKFKLPKNVFSTEKIDNMEKLADYYSLADVFVNLSHEDSFGLVSAESLSCGTPVIAYNSTACGEIVGDEKCGFVVEDNDFDAVINAVNIIKKNKKSYYSKNCRDRALLLYDKDKTNYKYLQLYELMNKKKY